MPEQNRLIVITGATRGLGRALVNSFVERGHRVAGCGRGAEQIAELQQIDPMRHLFASVDVTDAHAVEGWAHVVLGTVGVPDILINNAAIITDPAPLWQVPREDFDRLIDVNIKGVVNVLRAFLPAMVARETGLIINLSSGWGRSTSPNVAPYCASKFAIEGLSKALAQELPKGMACVPLNPGVIDTDMLRQSWNEGAAQYQKPHDWAERAAPLILKLGANANGNSLSVLG